MRELTQNWRKAGLPSLLKAPPARATVVEAGAHRPAPGGGLGTVRAQVIIAPPHPAGAGRGHPARPQHLRGVAAGPADVERHRLDGSPAITRPAPVWVPGFQWPASGGGYSWVEGHWQ